MTDSAMLDFGLGETADAIRETTARYAADRIAPMAAAIDARRYGLLGSWRTKWSYKLGSAAGP